MSLLSRIKDQSDRLTSSDKRLIEVLLGQQDEAVFLSAAQLASRAQVHETTATRLAQKLGYSGYPELRAQLRDEVLQGQEPATRIRRSVAQVAGGDYLANLVAGEQEALNSLLRCVSQADLDAAADMIVAAQRVFVFAQGHAVAIAGLLRRRMDRFGFDTAMLTGRGREIAERAVAMTDRDLVVALAFRRQPDGYDALMGLAAMRGARTMLISDLAGPTMTPPAEHVIAAPRGRSGSEFQSLNVPMTIINAILLTIAGRHEQQVVGKLEELADLFDRFG